MVTLCMLLVKLPKSATLLIVKLPKSATLRLDIRDSKPTRRVEHVEGGLGPLAILVLGAVAFNVTAKRPLHTLAAREVPKSWQTKNHKLPSVFCLFPGQGAPKVHEAWPPSSIQPCKTIEKIIPRRL